MNVRQFIEQEFCAPTTSTADVKQWRWLRYGRRQAVGAIKAHLRDLIPLIRSLTVGLPR